MRNEVDSTALILIHAYWHIEMLVKLCSCAQLIIKIYIEPYPYDDGNQISGSMHKSVSVS